MKRPWFDEVKQSRVRGVLLDKIKATKNNGEFFDAMRQRQLVDGQRRLMAFEALAARQALARTQKQQRQAQRESDEFAARALRIHTAPESI